MDKIDHLMAEKNENNKDSQKGQVTPKKNIYKKNFLDKRLTIMNNLENRCEIINIRSFCSLFR
jgi:hypothetical protein